MVRKDKQTSGNPTWLKWIVVIFIAYAVFINYTERTNRPGVGDEAVLGVSSPKDDGVAMMRADFGSYLLPKGVSIGGDIPGNGEEARCGQTATLIYDEQFPETATAQGEKAKEVTLQVGVDDGEKPWISAISGMQKGGVRQIKVLASKRFSEEALNERGISATDYINYKVEMKSVTPESDMTQIPFQATDRKVGTGETASCGTIVDFHVVIWGHDGIKQYDSREANNNQPLTMKVGDSTYLYGFDRGILNMKKGGIRTLLIPAAYAAPHQAETNPFKTIIQSNQVVIAELSLLDVRWK